jgi:ubiquinone/menaquinone biosynthesis C-methylase UbiE
MSEKHLSNLYARFNNPSIFEVSQRESAKYLLRKVKVKAKAKALSISVGDGTWDYMIMKKLRLGQVVATDIVNNPVLESDVKRLNELSKWKFVKLEAEKRLPFKDGEFDLIWHFDVIEHVEKPYMFLSEQYRVLKPGGYLLFNTPNLLRLTNMMKLFVGRLKFPEKIGYTEEIGDYVHIQEYTEWNLENLIREVGFSSYELDHSFFGLHFMSVKFLDRPKSRFGKSLSQYLTVLAQK